MQETSDTSKRLNYENYGFEDFLQDPFFVDSMTHPTQESDTFWRNEERRLKKHDEYLAACEYLKAMQHEMTKTVLSDDEIEKLQERIGHTINNNSHRLFSIRLYRNIGIAASFLLLLGLSYIFLNIENKTMDISTFAQQERKLLNDSINETLLVLSDDQQIKVRGDEGVVDYNKYSEAISVEEKKENTNEKKECIEKEKIAPFNELITPKGKRSQLILSDGSVVWLNSGTRVVYPKCFEKDKREIYVDGEIFIDVKPDRKIPFYVKTNDLNIRVLGTKFNVTSYSGTNTESVVLVSGSVSVDKYDGKSERIILKPSQMYSQVENNVFVKDVDVRPYISWVDGVYEYKEEMIVHILSKLSEYYGVQMEYNNVNSDMLYSGKLDLKQSIDEVLNGLKTIVPMEYVTENGKYIINFKK